MTTLALPLRPTASIASRRSATHKLALALVWLTVASGAVVFTEPAPFDVLTVGLVVLLPAIGLVAISPALTGLLALMLVAAAAAFLAATNAVEIGPAAIPHRRLALSLRRHLPVRRVRGQAPGRAHPPDPQRLYLGGRWRRPSAASSATSAWFRAPTS